MNIDLNTNEFEAVVANNKTVVLDFYADWCGPCQAFSPTIHKLADEFYGNVSIRKVNVDNNKELAARFGVRSIPTLVYLTNGEETDRSTGLVAEKALRERINQINAA